MTKCISKEDAVKMTQEGKTVQTACWDCVFARSQNKDNQNLEDYCLAERLKPLEDNGAEIIDVSSEQKNEKFKIVNKRICNMFRTKIWKEHVAEDGITEDSQLLSQARKEINLICTCIIYVSDCGKEEKEELSRKEIKQRVNKVAKDMNTLCSGRVSPAHITVINNTSIKPYDFLNYLRIETNNFDNIKCNWNMEYINPQSIDKSDTSELYRRCLDIVTKNDKSHYFSVFFEGNEISKDYLSKIDEALNDKSQRFLVLLPEKEGDGGLFIQKIAYKQFLGNREGSFVDKIKEEAKKQKCQSMIRPLAKTI
jgi:hypothetical protein